MEQTLKLLIVLITSLFSLATMGQKFHTEFKYDDTPNRGITIQNSYPKGGQKYTAPNGKAYVYVIFWTRVTNETDADLELSVDFPIDSFTVPSSPDIYFHLYLPKEEMTLDKESLFNYGLDFKAFLDQNVEKPTELVKTISPNESHLFYVIALSNKGINGVVRAGFALKERNLIYTINDREITCGKILPK